MKQLRKFLKWLMFYHRLNSFRTSSEVVGRSQGLFLAELAGLSPKGKIMMVRHNRLLKRLDRLASGRKAFGQDELHRRLTRIRQKSNNFKGS